jgi:hypothetical protein
MEAADLCDKAIEFDPKFAAAYVRRHKTLGSYGRRRLFISSITLIELIFMRVDESKPGRYLIVDGERRWRFCKKLNFSEIACRILPTDSDEISCLSVGAL